MRPSCFHRRVRCQRETLRDAYYGTKAKREYIQPKPAFFGKLVERERDWVTARTKGEPSAAQSPEPEPGSGDVAIDGVSDPSITAAEYELIYLLDHFGPMMWVEGVTKESVTAAYEESGRDYGSALAKLNRILSTNM
eukprot:SAG31_NODE_1540_length_7954_cov_3.521961_3_plen_137_part_00